MGSLSYPAVDYGRDWNRQPQQRFACHASSAYAPPLGNTMPLLDDDPVAATGSLSPWRKEMVEVMDQGKGDDPTGGQSRNLPIINGTWGSN